VKPKKEKTQKPIMTLPPDAISRAKAGGRAPLEQFTKKEDKKRETGTGKRAKHKPPAGVPDALSAGELPSKPNTAKTKDRRNRSDSDGDGEGKKKLAGMASARASRQQKRRGTRVNMGDDDDGRRRSRRRLTRRGNTNTAAPRKEKAVVALPCTVRSLSEASGVPTVEIQRALMSMGTMATINAEMDPETAEYIATELGMEIEFKQPESLEDTLLSRFEISDEDADTAATRPPIITFLGHVDHGKTSLLDYIIGIDVVTGEAGGITQHIRAYKIDKDGRELSFVDTPGHEAFTEMRARGANVTDIAVLVVAADDGVMPQTEEAISHARAANVPIVVALNKVDLPGADVNKAFQDLSTHGLLPTEWGGDVEVIKTSAITGEGIDDLLETLLLTAELHEYKADPSRDASGVCLEAQQDVDRGVVAKMIVKNGTLRVGDIVVCGGGYGRVKALYHTLDAHKKMTEAGPSTPVSVTGLDMAPEAGEPFYVLNDIAEARQIAESRKVRSRSQSLSGQTVRVSFEEFQRRLEEGRLDNTGEVTMLNLVLRADVRGSIEAIQKELEKLDHPEVKINVLQATVGAVTSADVTLADASDAVIVGFNVIPDESARSLADQRGVEIRRYDIIYKVTEDLKLMLEGRLKPEERVKDLGRALVQRLFTISRIGTIAGCRVLAGKIERGCRIRLNRDGRGIGDYPLDSLRRDKDDTKEVREGFECGIKLAGFNDLKEGDILEAYKMEEVKRTL
jgi:translation initiation factor IF-2